VHIVAVPKAGFEITAGKEFLKEQPGDFSYGFCTECGGGVKQHPKGAPFVATFPVCYKIEVPLPSSYVGDA